ncbi:hypothetical protein OC835_005186 [Tilletia horrida]|nr:hypothetical protein OC835_005186 [Tilletia horrida]
MTSSTSPASPKIEIAIIGGGPVGMAAARILQHKDHAQRYHVTVYELEAGEHARWQGSSLDLRPNTGLRAIVEAGLLDVFMRKARPDGEEMRFCDKYGKVMFEHAPFLPGSTQPVLGNPEIARGDLRDVLMHSLKPGTIEWGHKLSHVAPSTTSPHRYVAHFTNGNQVEADLIVGADGAWSRTRNLLTDIKPIYTGLTYARNTIANPWQVVPATMELAGKGLCFFFSGDGQINAHVQVNSSEEATLSVSVLAPESYFQSGGFFSPEVAADPARSRAALHKVLDGFTPLLTDTIDHMSGDVWSGGLYSMPDDVAWQTRLGVTLIGDAVHCTTPHAGEGANTGMVDALELVNKLVTFDPSSDADVDVHDAFATFLRTAQPEFEADLFERAHKLIKLSMGNTRRLFTNPNFEDAIRHVRSRLDATLRSKPMTEGKTISTSARAPESTQHAEPEAATA